MRLVPAGCRERRADALPSTHVTEALIGRVHNAAVALAGGDALVTEPGRIGTGAMCRQATCRWVGPSDDGAARGEDVQQRQYL